MAHWRPLIILLLLGVLAAAQLGKVPQALVQLQVELQLSATQSGWAVSLITLIGALLGGVAGPLSERLGMRRVLLLGAGLMALAGLASVFSNSAMSFLFWRALEGVGYLAVVICAPALLSRYSRDNRTRALSLSLWGGFVPLGFAVIAGLFALSASFADWRELLFVSAVAMLLVTLLAAWQLPPLAVTEASDGVKSKPLLDEQREAYCSRGPLVIGLAFGVYATQSLMFIAFLPSYLQQYWALTPTATFSLAAALPLLGLTGNALTAMSLRKGIPCIRIISLALMGMGIAALVMYSAHAGLLPVSLAAATALSIASGSAGAALFAAVPALLIDARQQTFGFALIAQFGSAGVLLGPPLAGLVVGLWGWPALALPLMACSLLAIMLLTQSAHSPSARQP